MKAKVQTILALVCVVSSLCFTSLAQAQSCIEAARVQHEEYNEVLRQINFLRVQTVGIIGGSTIAGLICGYRTTNIRLLPFCAGGALLGGLVGVGYYRSSTNDVEARLEQLKNADFAYRVYENLQSQNALSIRVQTWLHQSHVTTAQSEAAFLNEFALRMQNGQACEGGQLLPMSELAQQIKSQLQLAN